MMKIRILILLLFSATLLKAQTPSEKFAQRYDMLVSQFGVAGVGVETVLDNWAQVDSTDAKLLLARFDFLFAKSQSVSVVVKDRKKYLGMDPVLTLKDSLQQDVFYFQEIFYDDDLYGQAIKAIDKAITTWPDKLDFRFVKANALIAYEKESPDMAMSYLRSLVAEASKRTSDWDYAGTKVGKEFISEAMQEYCYSFYTIGSEQSRKAFLQLSTLLMEEFPDNIQFVNNIGSYYLTIEDYKTALKYYNKVLKNAPNDYTAIKNSALAARRMKNVKLEKKFLKKIVECGPEGDARAAEARYKALNN